MPRQHFLPILLAVSILLAVFLAVVPVLARPNQVIYPTNLSTGGQYYYMWYDGGDAYGGLLVVGCSNNNPEIAVLINNWSGSGYVFYELVTLPPGVTAPELAYRPKLKDLSTACRVEVSSPTKNILRRFYMPLHREPMHLDGFDGGMIDSYPPPYP